MEQSICRSKGLTGRGSRRRRFGPQDEVTGWIGQIEPVGGQCGSSPGAKCWKGNSYSVVVHFLRMCQMRSYTRCSTILSEIPRFARTLRFCPTARHRSWRPTSTPRHINNGYAVIVGTPSFIAPYASLNAHGGIIKIGNDSDILDNATIVANPLHPHTAPAPQVLIGNGVLVLYGAQILGPSTIGAYGSSAKPTEIGPGAVIDQANIEPGAIVSALARVGPGVTVPSGYPSFRARMSPRMRRPQIPRWAWSCGSRAVI